MPASASSRAARCTMMLSDICRVSMATRPTSWFPPYSTSMTPTRMDDMDAPISTPTAEATTGVREVASANLQLSEKILSALGEKAVEEMGDVIESGSAGGREHSAPDAAPGSRLVRLSGRVRVLRKL